MTNTIAHHPDGATLMSYAAGTLGEALSAAVACHLDMCEQCRHEADGLDVLGAILVRDLVAEEPGRKAFSTPAQSADVIPLAAGAVAWTHQGQRGTPHQRPAHRTTMPAALARRYASDFADIPWQRLAPGIWHHRLDLSQGSTGDLRLLKIAAGRRMPEHAHDGTELTLVLDGTYSDDSGTYRPGDMADVDDDFEHSPIADAALGCVCLIASERPARFKSVFVRLLRPLTGL